MTSSKLPNDGNGDTYVRTYDDERFLTEEEASQFDWKKGIRIIMIGKTGDGKSATGNTMMGQTWFESDSSGKSITLKGKAGRMKWKDQHIKIVDTPGLCDNRMSENDLQLEMIKCMTLVLPGPHIIMYVIRIGRYTKEDIEVADKFLEILGENPYKYIIIVLTGRDDLEFHNKSEDSYLKTVTPEFTRFAKKCNQRYIFVDNRSRDSKGEWSKMYSAIDKMYSAIDKMLLENQHFYYTTQILQQLNEVFDGIIIQRSLVVEISNTLEEIIAILENDVENEGSVLYTLVTNASIAALSCGLFSAIFELTVPMIAAGAMIGAGGAVVSVGGAAVGAYALHKSCTIS